MSRLFFIAFAGLLLSSMLTAQKNPPSSQGLPPLIDRELLFGDPEITAAEVSPDGKLLYQFGEKITILQASDFETADHRDQASCGRVPVVPRRQVHPLCEG